MSTPTEWFERFFPGLYGEVLAGQFSAVRTLKEARLVKRLLKLRNGQKVLDVPCGMGRLTIPLAKMGLKMTGVDLTAPFIRRARRRATKERATVRFMHCDMRDIAFEGEFDAAVNWFSSFGYFAEADNLRFAKRALAALKPGGQFLVEVMNKTWLMSHLHPGRDETINGVRLVNRPRWNRRTNRIRDTWTMSKAGRTERRTMSMRVYSGAEMRRLLQAAGFRDVRVFDRRSLGPVTRGSKRFIAIGRRPE